MCSICFNLLQLAGMLGPAQQKLRPEPLTHLLNILKDEELRLRLRRVRVGGFGSAEQENEEMEVDEEKPQHLLSLLDELICSRDFFTGRGRLCPHFHGRTKPNRTLSAPPLNPI